MTTVAFGVKEQEKKVAPAALIVLGTRGNVAALGEKFPEVLRTLIAKPQVTAETLAPIAVEASDAVTVHFRRPDVDAQIKGKDAMGSVTVATFSSERSRHNAVLRADSLGDATSQHVPKKGHARVIVLLDSAEQAFAAGCAVARCFPLYSRKTGGGAAAERTVYVDFAVAGDAAAAIEYARIQQAATGIRLAQRLVDTPTNELHTSAYVREVEQLVAQLPQVDMQVIRNEDLRDRGYGGLWNVGKAAEHGPALVVLTYTPEHVAPGSKVVAMVGKGIVYDSGGLSIKSSQFMVGMKADMGGSAGILGAFVAAVRTGYCGVLHALLCIAENSVSERSQRPDDVITAYSGKTIEVNNTDAEGRLVLADGVAHATKHLNPDVLIDMATLTGAQAFATGLRHCGVLCNSAELEARVLRAARESGDLAFPLIYAPEFLGISSLFPSQIADMKNSSKERNNAGSSGAGHFVEEHICGDGWKQVGCDEPAKQWLHLDIAYPAVTKDGRGTGFGVALLLQLLLSFV